tara:strand:+ start:42 stop:692 length:651 start_codon:yes stop_codon:yes gene_type:complete
LKSDFYKNGYVKINQLFDQVEILKIKKDVLNYENKKKPSVNKLLHIEKKIPSIKKFIGNDYLKFLLKYILNYEDILGLQTEIFFNPPGTKGYGFHQDDFFLMTGKNNSANLWIPLVKTNKKNGTLNFLKQSNDLKIMKKVNESNLKKGELKKSKKYKKISINCNFGDAILISNRVFHGSTENKSKSNRYVLAVGYIRKGASYRRGYTAKRKPFKLI